MCGKVMVSAVGQLLNESMSLIKVVPSYDHLMNGSKLNASLAAKHLVGWPSKKAFGVGCIAIEKAIKDASKAHTSWRFDGSLKDDSSYAEAINQVNDNYLTSKKALATIVGVSCLANLVGAARLESVIL